MSKSTITYVFIQFCCLSSKVLCAICSGQCLGASSSLPLFTVTVTLHPKSVAEVSLLISQPMSISLSHMWHVKWPSLSLRDSSSALTYSTVHNILSHCPPHMYVHVPLFVQLMTYVQMLVLTLCSVSFLFYGTI